MFYHASEYAHQMGAGMRQRRFFLFAIARLFTFFHCTGDLAIMHMLYWFCMENPHRSLFNVNRLDSDDASCLQMRS